MPYGYGPMPGPRQAPEGTVFDWTNGPYRESISISFLTDGAKLEKLLPPGFSLIGEPIVTVELQRYTRLEWLAGRGYNTLGVRFPAQFRGEQDEAVGSFLSVLWENLADPIISGREELGYSKLYCELPEKRILRGREIHSASWLGHEFARIEAWDFKDNGKVVPPALGLEARNDGSLHYKYIPRTGNLAVADVAYACLAPRTGTVGTVENVRLGEGTVSFVEAEWKQLPTLYHIVNALAALPNHKTYPVIVSESIGSKDFSDQRILL
jgi:hypothetical protein